MSGNITSIINGAEKGAKNSAENNSKNTTSLTTATMEYDQNNRLTKYNGQAVKYDADGNMTYGPLNGEMATFVYDCRNRLIQAGTTKYEYDAENHRTAIIKNVGSTTETRTEFLVDSVPELSQILQSTTYQNGKVTEQQSYVYGNGLISQHTNEAGNELYYHFNNVGSTTAVTDASGNVKYSYEYSPYGELISGTYGQVMFLYNGQYGVASDDNGLYYMRARYYNIAIKRFINQDVLTGEIGQSQSLNRFAYVEGNPVTYLDPFGLQKDTSTTVNSVGLSINVAYWLALGVFAQLTTDGDGRTALQWGVSFGFGTPGASASIDTTGANGKGYQDTLGLGLEAGIGAGWGGYSAGVGGSMGIGNKYKGATSSVGVGTPGLDLHIKASYTWNIWDSVS